MSDSRSLADRIIDDAMRSGVFSNLPGEGRPLSLEDDPHTPEPLRVAHKLLRDNDMAPEWIGDGAQLEQRREAIVRNLHRAARGYRCETCSVSERNWQHSVRAFETAAQDYNRRLLSYNLKVPAGVPQRSYLDAEREVRRALEAADAGA